MSDREAEIRARLKVEDAASGISGCDAVFPYDADRAYTGMKDWATLLLAEADALRARLTACEEERDEALRVYHMVKATEDCRIQDAEARVRELEEAGRVESRLRRWLAEEEHQGLEAREAAESYRGISEEAVVDLNQSANHHEATARKIRRVLGEAGDG